MHSSDSPRRAGTRDTTSVVFGAIGAVYVIAVTFACILSFLLIDRAADFTTGYAAHERALLRLGILHHTAKCFDRVASEEIDGGESGFVLLLGFGASRTGAAGDKNGHGIVDADGSVAAGASDVFLAEAAADLRSTVHNSLRLSVSIVIGPAAADISGVPSAFEWTEALSRERFLAGHGSIITGENAGGAGGNGEYRYPLGLEFEFAEAMRSGDTARMLAACDDIVSRAGAFGRDTVMTAMSNLAYASNRTISDMNGRSAFGFRFVLDEFLTTIKSCETLDEANVVFHRLFERIRSHFDRKRAFHGTGLLPGIVETIRGNYADRGLSIAQLADRYDISPAYLGRIFRKYTGKSMPDFINEVRIEKAKELFAQSRAPIADIIGMTGFTNNTHFFRMFKKYIGVTPKEYRTGLIADAALRSTEEG
jgi:AraC-like DNA-binding protein